MDCPGAGVAVAPNGSLLRPDMVIALTLLLVVSTYLVMAVSGMHLLKRLGFATQAGATNAPGPAALIAAAAINLAILATAILEVNDLASLRIDFRFAVTPRDLAFAALAMAGTAALGAAFATRLGARRRSLAAYPLGEVALALVALLCAALMEEVLFRAIAIETLRPLGAAAAIGGSAVLFTLIHLPTSKVTPEAVLAWLAAGIAFGLVWWMGAPLLAVTALHFARNAANMLWVTPSAQFGIVTPVPVKPAARLAYYLALSIGALALALPFYAVG